MMANKDACHLLCQRLYFLSQGDMVQILLMLEVLFTQDSKIEDLFYGAPSGSEPNLFFGNYLFS